MHVITHIVVCFYLALLVSCASYHDAVKRSQDVAACKITCQQRLQQCGQVCHNDYRQCNTAAYQSAVRHYDHYLHEQAVKGQNVVLELKSFRDPLQCLKITCECSTDYLVCKQSCTGKIRKRLQVIPAC